MKDRFQKAKINQRMRRQGAEPADGEWPRELQQPFRQELSKAGLRAMAEEAIANTARLTIKKIPTGKRRS
jgi:hypothetical protein